MKVELILIEKLKPNPWNPNEVNPKLLFKIKAEIKRTGLIEPLVVRPQNGVYQIINGEHRALVLKELSYKTAPCIVVKLDDQEAKIKTLNLNYMRGQAVPVKLANLIHDLNKKISLKDLEAMLPYEEKELKNDLNLLKIPQDLDKFSDKLNEDHFVDVDFVVDIDKNELIGDFIKKVYKFADIVGVKVTNVKTRINPAKETISLVSFKISEPQKEVIERAIKHASTQIEGKNKRGRAIEFIAADYLAGAKQDEKEKKDRPAK